MGRAAADAALPAEPVDLARYLVAHATPGQGGLSIGTLTRRLSAISKAHLLAGHGDPGDDPAVREVLRGLRRQHGSAKQGAPPLWTSDVERIIAATRAVPSPRGAGLGLAEVRDRALLLAFSTALRCSELSALDLSDLEPDPSRAGRAHSAQQDRPGRPGQHVGVPYATRPDLCPVRTAAAWRQALAEQLEQPADQLTGPMFRPVERTVDARRAAGPGPVPAARAPRCSSAWPTAAS